MFGSGADLAITDECHQNKESCVNFPFSYNFDNKYTYNQEAWTLLCGNPKGKNFKVKEYEVFEVIWWRNDIYLIVYFIWIKMMKGIWSFLSNCGVSYGLLWTTEEIWRLRVVLEWNWFHFVFISHVAIKHVIFIIWDYQWLDTYYS